MVLTVNLETLSEVGQNVMAGMVDNRLVLVIDPKVNLGPSTSGKMTGVANTSGFALFPSGLKGNVYIGRKV